MRKEEEHTSQLSYLLLLALPLIGHLALPLLLRLDRCWLDNQGRNSHDERAVRVSVVFIGGWVGFPRDLTHLEAGEALFPAIAAGSDVSLGTFYRSLGEEWCSAARERSNRAVIWYSYLPFFSFLHLHAIVPVRLGVAWVATPPWPARPRRPRRHPHTPPCGPRLR